MKTESHAYDAKKKGDVPFLKDPGGRIAATIESRSTKMPWVSWLGLAVISMAASATIAAARKKEHDYASFVGLWAPCFLIMGIYGKLVQIEKKMSDQHARMPPPIAEVPNASAYLS